MTLSPPALDSGQGPNRLEPVPRLPEAFEGRAPFPAGHRRHRCFQELIDRGVGLEPIPAGVVYPMDRTALLAAVEAAAGGVLEPTLIGPAGAITATARAAGLDISPFPILDAPTDTEAAAAGAAWARGGPARVLMKGSLHTSTLLHAVLSHDTGGPSHQWVSHVFVFDVPAYPKPLLLSDAVVAIAPTLEQKAIICRNAITVGHALGIAVPRVAILSAVEDIEPAMTSTLDAAALCKMADRGQITGALLDGPLAMDIAISASAAAMKGIFSPVAGDADVLIVPNLEAGNILYKSLTYLANAEAAGVIVGGSVPVILASRADSVRTRIASAALAAILATTGPSPGKFPTGWARRSDGSMAGSPFIKEKVSRHPPAGPGGERPSAGSGVD